MNSSERKQAILARYPEWHNKPFLFNTEEMDNPYQVYKEFFDAYSLPNIRVCLWNWLYSACHDEFAEAINLLTLYRHCERLIEASYLIYERWNRDEHDHSPKDTIIRTMEDFFGIFSHEIRAQLSGITQCSQSIQNGVNTDYYLQAINAISLNALNVLDNMLTTVKFHAGKLDIRVGKEPFRFCSWIKTIIQSFEAATTVQEKDICLTIHPSLTDADITTDKVKLWQILHNLLANALKFSYPGTCIAVKCYAEDTGLVVQVINQGSGISADQIDTLFTAYQQLDGGHAGTGLGLYLSQLYAQALGGKIAVQSEENATTVFTVHIPGCVHPKTIPHDKAAM